MSSVTSDRPPHLWMVTPAAGYLCVLCLRAWAQTSPYEPCHAAPAYAIAAIKQAEAASGMTLAAVYDGLNPAAPA